MLVTACGEVHYEHSPIKMAINIKTAKETSAIIMLWFLFCRNLLEASFEMSALLIILNLH